MKSLVALLGCVCVLSLANIAQATDHHRVAPSVKSYRTVIATDCAPAGPCCVDATVTFTPAARPCYTPQGIKAFIAIFSHAAEKGVENATIRAMNGTKVCADCEPQEAKK